MINIAHNDRNVFVTNIIDVGTFRTVKNCSALNPYQHDLLAYVVTLMGAGLRERDRACRKPRQWLDSSAALVHRLPRCLG
jgi:hypothetical protein